MAVQGISLEPESFVQGGLINDVDVEITEIMFCGWDYDGHVNDDILAVRGTLCLLDNQGRPDPNAVVDQYWSAGGLFSLVGLSDDGYTVLPGPNKTALTKGSNLDLLITSLRKEGMPKGYLGDNIGRLKGLQMHVLRTAVKREGMQGRGTNDKEAQTLICTKILRAPWDAKGARAATRTTTTAATTAPKTNGAAAASQAPAAQATNGAAAAAPDEGIESRAVASVTAALNEVEGNMFPTVKDLKVAVFRRNAKEKADLRNQIVKLVEDTSWLEGHGFSVMDGAVIGG